uniref:Uncharacterized protein n=1 Tax=Aureoumbra lagunensis TaxID=44058 RepID=A0A7S3NER4_9STRA|mmetsp:Transcript_2177/g.3386  ORF Transcript_2177/g.3386 Transcript_2177/m.3386 type:complete len:440 (+) Transcript_2177:24-1343(+)
MQLVRCLLVLLAQVVGSLRLPTRMQASSVSHGRVLVCGSSSVKSVLMTEIERSSGWTLSSTSNDCDAVVICGSDDTSANALAREVRVGKVPSRVVITLPRNDVSSSLEDTTLLSPLSWFSKRSDEAFDIEILSEVSFVTIIRHGELFGSDGTPPLVDGLRKNPQLSQDVVRRGVRLSPGRRQSSTKLPTMRRLGLARLALELLEYKTDQSTIKVELESSSLTGPEPKNWSALIDEALKASELRTALRLKLDNTAPGLDQLLIQDWIIEQWGPAALRSNSAAYATTGARPVAFERKELSTALRYEDFDGSQVTTAGRLIFSYDIASTVLSVTRSIDDPLPGEQSLLDNFADAFTLTFSVEKKEQEQEELFPPVEEDVNKAQSLPEDITETPPPIEEVKKTPMRKRRTAVRARTSTASTAASSTTPSSQQEGRTSSSSDDE